MFRRSQSLASLSPAGLARVKPQVPGPRTTVSIPQPWQTSDTSLSLWIPRGDLQSPRHPLLSTRFPLQGSRPVHVAAEVGASTLFPPEQCPIHHWHGMHFAYLPVHCGALGCLHLPAAGSSQFVCGWGLEMGGRDHESEMPERGIWEPTLGCGHRDGLASRPRLKCSTPPSPQSLPLLKAVIPSQDSGSFQLSFSSLGTPGL